MLARTSPNKNHPTSNSHISGLMKDSLVTSVLLLVWLTTLCYLVHAIASNLSGVVSFRDAIALLAPTGPEFLLCIVPLAAYVVAVRAYGTIAAPQAHVKRAHVSSSTAAIFSSSASNLLLIRPLLASHAGMWGVRAPAVLWGMLVVDTAEFWPHWAMHRVGGLYQSFHYVHHAMGEPAPSTAFHNHPIDIALTTPPLLGGLLVCRLSFAEWICVTSLAFVATVCDHTSADPFAFHYVHHCVNRNSNFQQPFFTFYDQLMGTYDARSSPKLPFWPYPRPACLSW